MSKRKICVVIINRANYARSKSILEAVKKHPGLQLQLVVGSSTLLYRFGNAVDVIRKDGFKPDMIMYSIVEGENPVTMAKSTGLALIELTSIFDNLKPDMVVTIADRFETISTAISASYMNIPLAHVQGGEVTGSIDETVRHAVTKLSHIHFPSTKASRKRIIMMGETGNRVFTVGCPSIDLAANLACTLDDVRTRHEKSGVGGSIDFTKPYILVVQHPVTTEYGLALEQINETAKAVAMSGMQAIWLWPNVDAGSDDIAKGLRIFREKFNHPFIRYYRNFPPEEYLALLKNAKCIAGNSSSGIREGAYLGVPCVNIGTRQNGREMGKNVICAGY